MEFVIRHRFEKITFDSYRGKLPVELRYQTKAMQKVLPAKPEWCKLQGRMQYDIQPVQERLQLENP